MPRSYNPITGKPKRFLPSAPLDANVYDAALARLRDTFDRFDHIAVMFSGGKDSTVCLHLALQVARERGKLPLRVVHYDEEAVPYQTEAYVRRVAATPDIALEWFCLPQKHRNACSRSSPHWYTWAPEARDRWVRPLPPEAVTALQGFPIWPAAARLDAPNMAGLLFPVATYGRCAQIMGIRAQESVTRHRAVSARHDDNYLIPVSGTATDQGNVWKVYPIYDWQTSDVWTAPRLHGWDYNRAYDALDKAGIPPARQRCSPAYGEEPLEKLWTYQVCFPELWDRMLDRVPGAAAAARYALTELWSYRTRIAKPDDLTWEQFIAHYIAKFDPASQRLIAERIRWEIRIHHGKTADPILPYARHPLTGISWEWLAMIAMRGDFKWRKQRGAHSANDANWHDYTAERAALAGGAIHAAD